MSAARTGKADISALAYVKSHAASHLSQGTAPPGQAWKFNKANQNWLIRNVWNESEVSLITAVLRLKADEAELTEQVPEEYVDNVMRYLNTIKGGGRTVSRSSLSRGFRYSRKKKQPSRTKDSKRLCEGSRQRDSRSCRTFLTTSRHVISSSRCSSSSMSGRIRSHANSTGSDRDGGEMRHCPCPGTRTD